MSPAEPTRRQAIRLGVVGLAGIAVGGVGLSRTCAPWSAPGPPAAARGGAELVEPEILRSADGLLRVDLVAARQEIEVAGRQAQVLTYNATLPGPTWRVRAGDRIEVRLANDLDGPTNLHTHGLLVSPEGNGDNPFVSVAPGEAFDYRFDLPTDHPGGVYWYHPHHHGTVADQVSGGLYGTIVVEPDDDALPVDRERTLVVSDISLTPDGRLARPSPAEVMMGREGTSILVNGQLLPTISAATGERERWRVVNACTSRYLRLAIPGQRVELLGVDSGHEPLPRSVEDVLLAPGNRADLLVTMTTAGSDELLTLGHDRAGGMMTMMGAADLSGPATLATLAVREGSGWAGPAQVPSRVVDPDLRDRAVDAVREISFTMSMQAMMGGAAGAMGFDGKSFDADRTDQRVEAGAVESWTIRNPTPLDHPFHLHVRPMQVVETDGRPVAVPTWRDVVDVPAQGEVRVLVDFSRHPGRSVYHCHVLDHEDAGMMATVEAR